MVIATMAGTSHSLAEIGYSPRVEFGARFEPGNRILHGAGQDAVGFDMYRKNFDQKHQPLVYMTYIGLGHSLQEVKAWGDRVRHELDRLSPYKVIPQVGVNFTGGHDRGIGLDAEMAAGTFDPQLQAFAEALASFNRPIFLRIGYEFEGSWNNYQPVTFVRSWVRIVTVLRQRNLPFATVWCAAGASSGWPPPYRLMAFYPGDEWVDWWGVDIFSPDEFAKPELGAFLDAARNHRKPVMIGEMSPRYVGTLDGKKSWEAWFVPMIQLLKTRPEIKGTAYINWDWKEWSDRLGFPWHDWGDARLESNSYVRNAWVKELSNPIFQSAEPNGQISVPFSAIK